jgi:hypothetical protein
MAIVIIGLATLVILGSLTAFFPCVDMGVPMRNRPMRCITTMRTMFGVMAVFNASGLLMLVYSRVKETVRGIGMVMIPLSVFNILAFNTISGICNAVTMPCVPQWYPFAMVMSLLLLAVSVANVLLLRKRENEYE